jgi:hypothetical protein
MKRLYMLDHLLTIVRFADELIASVRHQVYSSTAP